MWPSHKTLSVATGDKALKERLTRFLRSCTKRFCSTAWLIDLILKAMTIVVLDLCARFESLRPVVERMGLQYCAVDIRHRVDADQKVKKGKPVG